MAEQTVKVDGLKELIASLRRIDRAYPKEVTKLHKDIAGIVAERAKQIVRRLTGRLAGSIRPLASQKVARVAAGRANIPYAGVQHYGWPRHNIEPQYYLTEALADKEQEVVRRYAEAIDELIQRLWVH